MLNLIQVRRLPLSSEDSVDVNTSLAAFKMYEKHNGKEAIINLRSNKKLDDFKPQWNDYIFRLQFSETRSFNILSATSVLIWPAITVFPRMF